LRNSEISLMSVGEFLSNLDPRQCSDKV
jgi:hypothetical protein